ncbi:hypothetical protein [Phosphitispora sp. TUW77]|uniref:hypothetical protein n=1 Tax=Phosphitispora sp. TUW77 TaxID=3152361 RepID=UPI003AB48016
MLRKLPILRKLSRIGIIEQEGQLHIIILASPAFSGVRQLKEMGCVFDGGYVFLPPEGAMVGVYNEYVFLSWLLNRNRLRRKKRKDKIDMEVNWK